MEKAWERELAAAALARAAGNEGRARVCARRAAGMAARDFLTRNRVRPRPASAYDALIALAQHPGLAPDLRAAASLLTLRVNEAFALPVAADPIAEARKLCEWLEGENEQR